MARTLFNRLIQDVGMGAFFNCRLDRNLCKGRYGSWGAVQVVVAAEMRAAVLPELLSSSLPSLPPSFPRWLSDESKCESVGCES